MSNSREGLANLPNLESSLRVNEEQRKSADSESSYRVNRVSEPDSGSSLDSNGVIPPAMDAGDWRCQLPPDSRQKIVNKTVETLSRHLPVSNEEWLEELRIIAVRIEEKIYSLATSQTDYLRRISLKVLTMESNRQRTIPDSL